MVRHGGATSCVELLSAKGTRCVLDMGTGSYALGQHIIQNFFKGGEDAKNYRGGSILITHTHWDHIQGFPFFVPLFIPGQKWDVYGPRGAAGSIRESLSGQMQYDYFPVNLDYLGANIKYHDLSEGCFFLGGERKSPKVQAVKDVQLLAEENEEQLYCQEIGAGADIRVTTRYLNHPCLTLGYRLEDTVSKATICYITDHEPYDTRMGTEGYKPSPPEGKKTADDKHVDFIRGADLLIHDSQYTAEQYPQKVNWGHSTIEYVVDVALAARVRRLALYHHDPMRTDDQIDELVELANNRIAKKHTADHSYEPLEVFATADRQSFEVDGGIDVPKISDCDGVKASKVTTSGQEPSKAVKKASALNSTAAASGDMIILVFRDANEAKPLAEQLKNGINVCVHDTVAKSIEAARVHQPALMLVQQVLQGEMNGIDICHRIREMGDWGRNVPFLIETDTQELLDDIRAESETASVTDLISKPYSPEYFRTKVCIAMQRTPCRWRKALLPLDEEERLQTLHATGILDTDKEERFDRITRIASRLFDTPIVLVSLVDRHRQWFKSCHGICASETHRDQAFCAHAILREDIFLIPDALKDDRFMDNPLVTGEPRIRFYAGIPLSISKNKSPQQHRMGTLCLIDRRPRNLDESQMQMLKDLGALVEQELQTSLATELLKQSLIRDGEKKDAGSSCLEQHDK